MKIDWCWACRREHPMLDDLMFAAVMRAMRELEAADASGMSRHPAPGGETPREFLLRLQQQPRPEPPLDPAIARRLRYRHLIAAYERVTGHIFDGDEPKALWHYRLSYYGPPCPYCGRRLRNKKASQCFVCGMDWHDPKNVVRRKNRSDRDEPTPTE